MAFYIPGQEPEKVKKVLNLLFSKLNRAYPDKRVEELHAKHKKLGEAVTKIYRALGYPDGKSFLEAYGYIYVKKSPGRSQTVDPTAIIQALQKKYPNGSGFSSVEALFEANPEYKPKLKTLKNTSTKAFGMPLGKYLQFIGLIGGRTSTVAAKVEKKKKYTICKVKLDTIDTPMLYSTTKRTLQEGMHLEVPYGRENFHVHATILACDVYKEDSLPCRLDETKPISKKLGVKEYESGRFYSILHTYAAYTTECRIAQCSSSSFQPAKTSCEKQDAHVSWAYCRGLSSEVIRVLDYLIEKEPYVYQYKDLIIIEDGICELRVYENDVKDILQNHPNVKMVMFAEDEENNRASLHYSRSGFYDVTDAYEIGECDVASKSRWTLRHSPTETSFCERNIQYTFKYEEDWLACNYVYNQNGYTKLQLG